MLLQVDANAQFEPDSRERGVPSTMAEAFGCGLRCTARHVQAERPADRKLLTSSFAAQTREAIPLDLSELSRIKVMGGSRRREPHPEGLRAGSRS
jgi:hypothetical protein